MVRYQYTYLDSKERKKKAYVEASSLCDAREHLKRKKVQLLQIKEASAEFTKMRRDDVLLFSKQLVLLLRSGLPLYESLLVLREQSQKQKMLTIISLCIDQLRVGKPLSQALAKYPSIFDVFYCNCIAAGEKTGNLEASLNNIIAVLEERKEIAKKLKAAMSYPLVLFIFSFFIITFFLVSVVPSLKETFDSLEVNRFSAFVFRMSDVICAYGAYLIIMVMLGGVGIFLTRKQVYWKRWRESLFFSFPITRSFCVKMSLLRFCSVTAAILRGGGTLIEGLEFGCQAIPYERLRSDVRDVIEKVVAGGALSSELTKKSWVPSLVVSMMALGEESGELTDVLSYVADIYKDDTQKILTWITSWSQPIILIVLGGVIGLIMLAILMPLTSGIQTF